MSSNQDLKDEAEALAAKLGVSVETGGKHRSTLEAMVAELQGKVQTMSDVDTDAPPASAEEEPEAKAKADAEVAEVAEKAEAEAKAKADAAAKAEADKKARAEGYDDAGHKAAAEAKAADEADAKAEKQRRLDAKAVARAREARKRVAINGAGPDSEGGPPKERAPSSRTPKYPYQVAPGCSITSTRGIRGPGEEVLLSDLQRNRADIDLAQKGLDHLVEVGVVVKG